jgi:metal-responsive CopG/Arc/MetJ family transcriptional regulator
MRGSISRKTAAELERLLTRREKKANASVSLSRAIIRAADAVAGKARRSALVERAMRSYLRSLVRRARNEHDLHAINARAEVTNRESDALLDLQAWPQ